MCKRNRIVEQRIIPYWSLEVTLLGNYSERVRPQRPREGSALRNYKVEGVKGCVPTSRNTRIIGPEKFIRRLMGGQLREFVWGDGEGSELPART